MAAKTLALGKPNEKQQEFFDASTRFVAYGGGRGGGKSWAVQRKSILLAYGYPGIKILILRRMMPELKENHILPMQALLQGFARYRYDDRAFEFPNGSRIRFGYCDNEADVLQYQGQEYDVIFIDEATQFTEFQYSTLTACMRGANDFPKRMYLTCNPGGVGHEWVKRLFIDREYRLDERAENYTFIQALLKDNPVLMEKDPEYMVMLRNLPDATRKAWLEGDWSVFEGQYFTEFDPAIHVCEPFRIPHGYLRYRSIDYGLDMFSCLFIAVDNVGRAVVYKEIHEPNLIITDAVKMMNDYTQADEHIFVTLAPPDMWNRRQETGKSVADIFAENGINLVRSSNDRVAGWMSMHEWLKVYVGADGGRTANMRIFSTCANLIKSIPNLIHDSKKPDDASTEPHRYTHAPDALRGFCVMWTVRAEAEMPDNTENEKEADQWGTFLSYGDRR